jgi:hypothetical protein
MNEPVAWMHKEATSWVSTFIHPETEADEWLPLYTHPAKTLTDEEILNVAFCCEIDTVSIQNDWDGTVIEFARAILKKASER